MRNEMKTFLIPQGTESIRQYNLLNGVRPSRLLFAVCPPQALTGTSYQNNPIYFPGAKYKINYVDFYVNEESVLPMPYQPDFANNDYCYSYLGFLKTLRLLNKSNPICPLDYDTFKNIFTVFGVDLSADASNLTIANDGNVNVSIQVRFKENLPTAATGLLIAEYRSCVYIDHNNNVVQRDM